MTSRLALLVALSLPLYAACDLQRSREPEPEEPPTWEEPEPEPEPEPPPPPPEPEPPPPPPEPEPEPPRRLRIGPAMLNGQWIGGPPSGFDTLLEIDGTLVTATYLGGPSGGERVEESTLFELVDVEGSHARFRAAGAGSIVAVHALFLTPDEALVWLIEDNRFAVLRRVGDLPDELLGEWQAVETGGLETVRRVTVEPARMRVDGETPATVYPLVATANTVDLVAVRGDRVIDVQMLYFRRLGEDVYLAWAEGGESFTIYYRRGARPDWLPGGSAAERPVSPEPVPTQPPEPQPPSDGSSANPGAALAQADVLALAAAAADAYQASVEVDAPGFPASTEWTPVPISTEDGDECPMERSGDGLFEHPTWRALGFRPDPPVTFQYRFVSETPETFEVQARTDADCDGVYHRVSLAGAVVAGEVRLEPIVEDSPGE